MMQIDSFFWGPELENSETARMLDDLRDAVADRDPDPTIGLELMYVVAGSLGGPDFGDWKVGVKSQKARRLRLLIAVPERVAHSVAPRDELMALTLRAVEGAGAVVGWFPVERYLSALNDAAERVRRSAPGPRAAAETPWADLVRDAERDLEELEAIPDGVRSDSSEVSHDVRGDVVSVEIHFPGPLNLSVMSDVEDRATKILEASGIASVDGNEIASDEFVLFIDTADPIALRSALREFINTLTALPRKPYMVLSNPDGDDPPTIMQFNT